MSFEYGSRQIEVGNPFRLEGLFILVRGLVIAGLGLVLVFTLRQAVAGADLLRWMQFLSGIGFLVLGFGAAGLGLFKLLRFYVGRDAPSDLSHSAVPVGRTAYTAASLAQMLLGRKNPTFLEPVGLIARGLHSLLPRLLFVPLPVRIVTQKVAEGAAYTVLALLLYGLAMFSGAAGLTPISDPVVSGWLTLFLTGFILAIWAGRMPRRADLGAGRLRRVPGLGLVAVILVSILLPVGLSLLQANAPGLLPAPPSHGLLWLGVALMLAAVTVATGISLASLRMVRTLPPTEVSEYRDHWQETLHPQDIYRSFDMVMADHRHLEIPNRIYAQADPRLMMQGSNDKGEFSGTTIQETQPVPADPLAPPSLRRLAHLDSALGNGLIAAAALLLFVLIHRLPTIAGPQAVLEALPLPLMLGLFGRILTLQAHTYLAEVEFASRLVYFFADGTYTESRLSTGMSIYDSNRSENTVVRCSLTPWLLAARIRSSTFAVSGAQNLEQYRYLMEMERDDGFRDVLVSGMRRFMNERQVMADMKSARDMEAASTIHQMNEATRPTIRHIQSDGPAHGRAGMPDRELPSAPSAGQSLPSPHSDDLG